MGRYKSVHKPVDEALSLLAFGICFSGVGDDARFLERLALDATSLCSVSLAILQSASCSCSTMNFRLFPHATKSWIATLIGTTLASRLSSQRFIRVFPFICGGPKLEEPAS